MAKKPQKQEVAVVKKEQTIRASAKAHVSLPKYVKALLGGIQDKQMRSAFKYAMLDAVYLSGLASRAQGKRQAAE